VAAAAAEAAVREASGNSAPAESTANPAPADSTANGSGNHAAAQRGTPPEMPVEISNEIPAQTRADLYHTRCIPHMGATSLPALRLTVSSFLHVRYWSQLQLDDCQRLQICRACAFVTTRILVVDILSGRLPGRWVAGVLVVNAHRVTDTSGEGFAVRLLRASNPAGFVRAFSDQPTSFGGFNKVSIVLFCCGLLLWCRHGNITSGPSFCSLLHCDIKQLSIVVCCADREGYEGALCAEALPVAALSDVCQGGPGGERRHPSRCRNSVPLPMLDILP
jgi:hypothetical protein